MSRGRKRKNHRQFMPIFRIAQDHGCFYCEEFIEPGDETFDHYQPLDKGGPDEMTNLVMCCSPCNSAKANRPPAAHRDEKFHRVQMSVTLMLPALEEGWIRRPHKPRRRASRLGQGPEPLTRAHREADRAAAERRAVEEKFGLARK